MLTRTSAFAKPQPCSRFSHACFLSDRSRYAPGFSCAKPTYSNVIVDLARWEESLKSDSHAPHVISQHYVTLSVKRLYSGKPLGAFSYRCRVVHARHIHPYAR